MPNVPLRPLGMQMATNKVAKTGERLVAFGDVNAPVINCEFVTVFVILFFVVSQLQSNSGVLSSDRVPYSHQG